MIGQTRRNNDARIFTVGKSIQSKFFNTIGQSHCAGKPCAAERIIKDDFQIVSEGVAGDWLVLECGVAHGIDVGTSGDGEVGSGVLECFFRNT